MLDSLQAVLSQLRREGYVVVCFSPEEVGEADPSTLEEVMVERGNTYLDSVNQSED